ncbi:tRNA dimethylallyltransferase 9, partial [Linum grandiflorum]
PGPILLKYTHFLPLNHTAISISTEHQNPATTPATVLQSSPARPPATLQHQHHINRSNPTNWVFLLLHRAPNKMLCSQLSLRSRCLRCFPRPFSTSSAAATAASKKKGKVVVISGPTGAGKSRLALELAKQLRGEIISADSVQVYRGLDVGSAKPSRSEREEVPHHLIDILDPYEEYSVGRFFRDAREATQDVLNRGSVPIVVGGTGLYLRWFIYGKPDVPQATVDVASEVDSELAELQCNHDWDTAVQLVVKAGDPRAQDVPVNNWYRLRRSLEIIKVNLLVDCLLPVLKFHIILSRKKQSQIQQIARAVAGL